MQRRRLPGRRLLWILADDPAQDLLRSRFEAALLALHGVAYDWRPESDTVERIGSLSQMLGEDELEEGTAAWWRARVHPDDLAQADAIMATAINTQAPTTATEYRMRAADGSWCWVWDHALLMYREDGSLDRVLGCSLKIDERKRAELALEQSQTRLGLALGATRMAVWESDARTRQAFWSPELYVLLGLEPKCDPMSIESLSRFMHPDDQDRIHAQFEATVNDPTSSLYSDQGRAVRADGEEIFFETRGHIQRDHEGRASIITGVFADVSEARRARQQVQLLIQALNHRAKNLLSVVQAIANQSAREEEVGESFPRRFSQRLSALAACHDLLVRSKRSPVQLEDLVRAQLAPFAAELGDRIKAIGPPLRLAPDAAQAISMALHELATNAGKYGALSNAAGHIKLSWGSDDAHVWLEWREQDGPAVSQPTRQGFGHRVMVDMIEMALGAEVSLAYPPDGLTWTLRAPEARVTALRPA